jgi:hypothetical protein
VNELASVRHTGRKWLFNNHGHRTLEWDDHCNRGYTRWILREHGLTLTGPEPASFVDPVPFDFFRREAAAALSTVVQDLASWIDIDTIAWGQRYSVVAACRMYYTLQTARVTTKRGALEWALRTLHPRWRPLLGRSATSAASAGTPPSDHARAKPTMHAPASLTSAEKLTGRMPSNSPPEPPQTNAVSVP